MFGEQQVQLRSQICGLRLRHWGFGGAWRARQQHQHEESEPDSSQTVAILAFAYHLWALPEWLLVDGSSMFFRAFYAIPQTMRSPEGKLINAVRGTLDNLARYVTDRRPRHVAFATDEDWRPDWRVDLIPSLAAVGVDVVGLVTLEAEDIIASLVTKVKPPIEIASGDRDLFSLIRDREVIVLYPEKGGIAVVDEAEVGRRYSIPGRAYADYAILRGDPSDGLPGLAGVGNKRAAEMVRKYGSVPAMLEAGIFRDSDATYLQNALRVVPPVGDLKIAVPRGRRDKYPEDPKRVEELGKKYGIANNFERLVKALSASTSP
jgi:5'-3' exonuclease